MTDSIAETDAIFARAFASAIKNKFSLDTGEEQILFLSPLVQRGISGGDLTYQEVTNYLTYKFGDGLLNTSDPSFLGEGVASYIKELRAYFDYVDTKNDRSPAVILRMAKAREAMSIADEGYENALTKAMKQYKEQKDMGITDLKFWPWTSHNAAYLRTAQETQKRAQTEFDSASQLYDGPQAAVLADYRNHLRDAMVTNPDQKFPGLNQDGIVADKDLVAAFEHEANGGKKPSAEDLRPYIVSVPQYGIQGYHQLMNDWMRLASATTKERNQVITINVNQGKTTKWEDYGFKEVHGSGSVGLFPFFWITAKHSETEEKYTLKTEGRESEISLSIAAVGLSLLPVNSGVWDVPNVKKLFQVISGAPDVLSSKHAKPMSVLVGYDIALTVKFGSSMKKEVHEMYEKARSSGGSLNIFGFSVSAGGGGGSSDHVETNFDDVKWDEATGTITLTPAPGQVYPSVLAVLARRL